MLQEVSTQDWLGDVSYDETHLNARRSPRSSVREQVPYVAIVVLLTACKLGPWHLTL